jgi:arginyl-tRNA synthetase
MFNATENEKLTPQQIRESLLQEIEASKQIICELNDEELEEIAGGTMSDLQFDTVLMHTAMRHGIHPNELATQIQTRIRENAEAGKTFEVSKAWTKPLTNPLLNPPKKLPGVRPR